MIVSTELFIPAEFSEEPGFSERAQILAIADLWKVISKQINEGRIPVVSFHWAWTFWSAGQLMVSPILEL